MSSSCIRSNKSDLVYFKDKEQSCTIDSKDCLDNAKSLDDVRLFLRLYFSNEKEKRLKDFIII